MSLERVPLAGGSLDRGRATIPAASQARHPITLNRDTAWDSVRLAEEASRDGARCRLMLPGIESGSSAGRSDLLSLTGPTPHLATNLLNDGFDSIKART